MIDARNGHRSAGEALRRTERETRFASLRRGPVVGRAIEWYASLPSTNDLARERARAGAEEGRIIVADEQTAGRGRRGRSWYSPSGEGLWFSVILRPVLPVGGPEAVLRLNRLGAEAVSRALRDGWSVPATVKHPNDVLVEGRKICGILCESSLVAGSDRAEWLVVGCGLNLSTRLPDELAASATRLADWVVPCPSAEEILARICGEFEAFTRLST